MYYSGLSLNGFTPDQLNREFCSLIYKYKANVKLVNFGFIVAKNYGGCAGTKSVGG